ncbi:MAG: hypothetical protein RL885_02895 [Planctomycetota bacterium]
MRLAGAVLLAACALALVATGAPLLVYSITLAVFGLPHVLVELRYVDERFRLRISRPLLILFGSLLAGIVSLRVMSFTNAASWPFAELELLLVIALVAAAGLAVRGGSIARALSMLTAMTFLAGALLAPLATLVLLAVLHNLTPIGFLAEALRGPERRRALLLCGVAFGVVPLVLLSGAAEALLASFVGIHLDASPFAMGGLHDHLGAFVPATWQSRSFGIRLFTVAAYLQCLHYAVVLYVLPRLSGADESESAWPAWSTFRLLVAALAGVFLIGFAVSFGEARAVYGFFAAVHAWVELPILLIALGGLGAAAHERKA